MDGLPGSLDITIRQNATFSLPLTWETGSTPAPVNLTGFTAKLDIREGEGGALILTLSTANGRIVLGGSAGTITLTIAAVDTAQMAAGQHEYDLLLTSAGGMVTPLLAGVATVVPGITQ